MVQIRHAHARVCRRSSMSPTTSPGTARKAECVIVIPSMTKVAMGIGGYGRGAKVCRSGKDLSGPWGAPAMYALDAAASAFSLARNRPTSCCGDQSPWRRRPAEQQGQAGRQRLGGGRTEGAQSRGVDRRVDARGDPQLLARAWPVCRCVARGHVAASGQPRQQGRLRRHLHGRRIITGDPVAVPESGRHLVAVLDTNAPRNESKKTASR